MVFLIIRLWVVGKRLVLFRKKILSFFKKTAESALLFKI